MFSISIPARVSHVLKLAGSLAAAGAVIAGCSSFEFGPNISTRNVAVPQGTGDTLPAAAGETIGQGPVRVALLLPLTGDLASVGTSMANGSKLAMNFIQSSPNISNNITIVLKDTRSSASVAASKASEAVSEGAKLIMGPLKAESVQAAGGAARAAGVPLIGFSNNSGAASPGVYLLNVLPETEVRRSLGFAQAQGRSAFAAIVPTTEFGRVQEGAYRQAIADLGLNSRAVFTFSNETEARQVVEQALQMIQAGQIDALFLPDRSTAPSFGSLLESAAIQRTSLSIIGSADWDGDPAIAQTPSLTGAVYPAVDPSGMQALRPQYQSAFGAEPHAFTTIVYTATLLANSSTLSQAVPPYNTGQLLIASGFNGRDGLFRFLPDGRSEYALIMKQVTPSGAQPVDGPKLP